MLKPLNNSLKILNEFIPQTQVVYESIEQHKYSRLANASYYYHNQSKNQQSFSKMRETQGFQLDKQLSNKEASVFVNQTTSEVVVAYRGTSSIKDVGTDLMVLSSTTFLSRRVRSSLKLMEKVLRKYRGFKVSSTGHSLGSFLSRVSANSFGLESHNFNSAESIHGTFQEQNVLTFNYRTHYDAVSILSKNSKRVFTKIGNESTLESVHRLNNFYDDNAKRVMKDGEEVFQTRKSSNIYEHTAHLGTVVDITVASYDIQQGVKNKERPLEIADTITRDILPPNPIQLFEDSETGEVIDSIIRDLVDEQASYTHHDKSFIETLIQEAENYNKRTTTDIAYKPHSIDVSTGYREVMGEDLQGIDRINPHRQNRFKPE